MRPALEVRLDDKKGTLLGWLDGHDPRHLRGKMLEIPKARVIAPADFDEAIEDGSPTALIDKRAFKISRMAREVPAIDFARAVNAGQLLQDQGIPPYAEEFRNPAQDSYRFVWSVLLVDVDGHEWLFDLDEFRPADDEPYVDPSEGHHRWFAGVGILGSRKAA